MALSIYTLPLPRDLLARGSLALSIYTLYPYPETCWPEAVWHCQYTLSTLTPRLAGPRQYGLVNIHSLPLPRDLLARGSMALSIYTLYPYPETCWPKAVWPCQYTLYHYPETCWPEAVWPCQYTFSNLTLRLAGPRQYGLVNIHSLPLP